MWIPVPLCLRGLSGSRSNRAISSGDQSFLFYIRLRKREDLEFVDRTSSVAALRTSNFDYTWRDRGTADMKDETHSIIVSRETTELDYMRISCPNDWRTKHKGQGSFKLRGDEYVQYSLTLSSSLGKWRRNLTQPSLALGS